MAEVEEELMNMEEEELDHMEGEVHENGEELNEDKEKDLDGIKLEVVEGNKEGSRWLIVDSVHICHKQQVFQNHDVWRCEDFRDYKCPFKIITTKEESENGLQIVTMTKTSQELRMLSSVTINCQITKIVMNSGSQLSEL